jgi:hypothetical protein
MEFILSAFNPKPITHKDESSKCGISAFTFDRKSTAVTLDKKDWKLVDGKNCKYMFVPTRADDKRFELLVKNSTGVTRVPFVVKRGNATIEQINERLAQAKARFNNHKEIQLRKYSKENAESKISKEASTMRRTLARQKQRTLTLQQIQEKLEGLENQVQKYVNDSQ